ncbi:hypothetical protein ACXZ9C_10685 [Streptococcus agalactiae]
MMKTYSATSDQCDQCNERQNDDDIYDADDFYDTKRLKTTCDD